MTGRLTTLGEAMREAAAAEHQGAAEEAAVATVEIRPDRVRRKLALLRSIGTDGTYTLRAAIGYQRPATMAN
jgi:hypothetical protein